MNQIKCKCGKTSMNFKKLGLKDFPNGWKANCCPDGEQSNPEQPSEEIAEFEPQEPEQPAEESKDESKAESPKEEKAPQDEPKEMSRAEKKRRKALQED